MGIGSGAFIGPSATRAMTEADAASLPNTQGVFVELKEGSASAVLVLLFLIIGAAFLLRRLCSNRSGRSPPGEPNGRR
jgi:hypothetical protein